ncbi:phasin family protein [Actinoplanes sp. RD1]|uniref:phasin family protein n=1 Tax=Actinoplanes sp. RD1 TaxID=3064538 RepID=UPI0027403533|nr:hypothetical protein [Actinoplanes sp. RD1]
MQNAWRAYLEMALGLTEVPRKRAQKVAGELLSKGGATAGQLQGLVEDLVTASASNREALTNLVRYEVDRALGRVGLATAEEVADLTTRVKDLERELAEAQSGGDVTIAAPGPAKVVPPARKARIAPVGQDEAATSGAAPAASAASATKAPAKKAPAKKAPGTMAPAKKAPGTMAPATKAVAKKAVAKKAVKSAALPPSIAPIPDVTPVGGTRAGATPVGETPADVAPAKAVPAKATKAAKASGATPAKKAPAKRVAKKAVPPLDLPEGTL